VIFFLIFCLEKLFRFLPFHLPLKQAWWCGVLIKSRKLHPSERAEDRNENYILFIFHHIFPHFPDTIASSPSCSFSSFIHPLIVCFFGGRTSSRSLTAMMGGLVWVRITIKKEAGWGFGNELCFAIFTRGEIAKALMMKITTN
jgi:hypothetical protein